jgi:hypothetical protein
LLPFDHSPVANRHSLPFFSSWLLFLSRLIAAQQFASRCRFDQSLIANRQSLSFLPVANRLSPIAAV